MQVNVMWIHYYCLGRDLVQKHFRNSLTNCTRCDLTSESPSSGPPLITMTTCVLEFSTRIFMMSWVWVQRFRGTQTQLKDGGMVLKLKSKNLSTIYFSRPHWPSTLIKYLDTCVVLTCTLKFMHTSPCRRRSQPICGQNPDRVVGVVGTVEKVFLVCRVLVTEHLIVLVHDIFDRGSVRTLLTIVETMSLTWFWRFLSCHVFGPVNHGQNWKGWERSGEKAWLSVMIKLKLAWLSRSMILPLGTFPWLSLSVILAKTSLKGLILIILSTYQAW